MRLTNKKIKKIKNIPSYNSSIHTLQPNTFNFLRLIVYSGIIIIYINKLFKIFSKQRTNPVAVDTTHFLENLVVQRLFVTQIYGLYCWKKYNGEIFEIMWSKQKWGNCCYFRLGFYRDEISQSILSGLWLKMVVCQMAGNNKNYVLNTFCVFNK